MLIEVTHRMKPHKLISTCRLLYQRRFVFRCAVLLATVLLYIFAPSQFDILRGFSCFERFSVFQLLWVFWMVDMVLQLCPCRHYWPLGSQKFRPETFKPITDRISNEGLLMYIKKCNRDTLLIGTLWFLLTLVIGALYFFTPLVDEAMLLVVTVFFYVCDIFCVLIWCPFKAWFMKNRCCTTCRIFNWDHMMMFAPLVFIPGFYTWSLAIAAFIVLFVWELTFALHPERFWDGTNGALRCSNCTDRLCGERNCQADIPDINLLKK